MRDKSIFKFTAVCVAVLTAPVSAIAQEVVLRSNDGNGLEITGTLLAFDGEIYTIRSTIGDVNIKADAFDCVGAICPVSTSATADPATAEGSVVWDVSLWGQRRAFTEHVEKLAELVDEKTDGAFTLNISYGGLSPSRENLDGIAAGNFEMAQFCAGYHPAKNPSITVLELPFLGISSIEQEREISQAVYSHPAVVADLARWNAQLLMPSPQPQYNILGVGTPPTSLASFEEMTVRATGGSGSAIEALGAETINIPADQVRDALTDGTVSAVAFAPHAHLAFDTIDSGVWWTSNLNPGTANCPVVVNTDALNALPSASRVALLSSVDEALDHFVDNYNNVTMAAWEEALQERGVFQLTISEDILSAINEEVAAPVARQWVFEATALGLPGQELYDLVTNMASGEGS
ncbi:MAG: C4-dicarboxylate ABC transporter substrate-binding protein [Pseudomonadota bacterium]